MPPIELKRGTDGELVIYNGVTRDTRRQIRSRHLGSGDCHWPVERASGEPPHNWRDEMISAPNQTRTELLSALAELSRVRPEWRLGQTIANIAMTAGRTDAGAVWDLEDDEALTAVRTLLQDCVQTGGVSA